MGESEAVKAAGIMFLARFLAAGAVHIIYDTWSAVRRSRIKPHGTCTCYPTAVAHSLEHGKDT